LPSNSSASSVAASSSSPIHSGVAAALLRQLVSAPAPSSSSPPSSSSSSASSSSNWSSTKRICAACHVDQTVKKELQPLSPQLEALVQAGQVRPCPEVCDELNFTAEKKKNYNLVNISLVIRD
jgi:cytochrome c553